MNGERPKCFFSELKFKMFSPLLPCAYGICLRLCYEKNQAVVRSYCASFWVLIAGLFRNSTLLRDWSSFLFLTGLINSRFHLNHVSSLEIFSLTLNDFQLWTQFNVRNLDKMAEILQVYTFKPKEDVGEWWKQNRQSCKKYKWGL